MTRLDTNVTVQRRRQEVKRFFSSSTGIVILIVVILIVILIVLLLLLLIGTNTNNKNTMHDTKTQRHKDTKIDRGIRFSVVALKTRRNRESSKARNRFRSLYASASAVERTAQASARPTWNAHDAMPIGLLKSPSSICLVIRPAARAWVTAQAFRAVFFWTLVRRMSFSASLVVPAMMRPLPNQWVHCVLAGTWRRRVAGNIRVRGRGGEKRENTSGIRRDVRGPRSTASVAGPARRPSARFYDNGGCGEYRCVRVLRGEGFAG